MGFFDFIKRLLNPSLRHAEPSRVSRPLNPFARLQQFQSLQGAAEAENAQSRRLSVRSDFFRRCPGSSQGIDDSAVQSLVGSTRHHSARQR